MTFRRQQPNPLRSPMATLPLAFALSACIQTLDLPKTLQPRTAPERPITTAEHVRVALLDQCIHESSNFLRSNKDTVTKQCSCYASAVAKAMSKDEIAYFANYRVVPTLTRAPPEEVKKRCSVTTTADTPARPRGK